MQDAPKAIWSISYVSVVFFPSLKQNFIAYRSSKVSSRPDYIFEIQQQWKSGFSRVYSNCCCSYSFEPEIIKTGQSSHKMYSNDIVNFQKSMTILNNCTKKVWKLIKGNTYFYLKSVEDFLPNFLPDIRLHLLQWRKSTPKHHQPTVGSLFKQVHTPKNGKKMLRAKVANRPLVQATNLDPNCLKSF